MPSSILTPPRHFMRRNVTLVVLLVLISLLGLLHNVFLSPYPNALGRSSLHPISAVGYVSFALFLNAQYYTTRRANLASAISAIIVAISAQRCLEMAISGWPQLVTPEIFSHYGLDVRFQGRFSPQTALGLIGLHGALLTERYRPRIAVGFSLLAVGVVTFSVYQFVLHMFLLDLDLSLFSLSLMILSVIGLMIRYWYLPPFYPLFMHGNVSRMIRGLLLAVQIAPCLIGLRLSSITALFPDQVKALDLAFGATGITLTGCILVIGMMLSRLHRELETAAYVDLLTGVLNRFGVEKSIKNSRDPMGVFYLDLDHFKTVNDSFGHAAGDLVLKEVSAMLQSKLTPNDLLGRWGGEEFIILTRISSEVELIHKAQELCDAIAQLPMDAYAPTDIHVTSSMGVSTYDPIAESFGTALMRVDKALYKAKERGRNQAVWAQPSATGAFSEPETEVDTCPAPAASPDQKNASETSA